MKHIGKIDTPEQADDFILMTANQVRRLEASKNPKDQEKARRIKKAFQKIIGDLNNGQ